MLRRPLLSLLLALVLGAGFVVGLAQLFVLRYEVGDVYPPYSTLRADPLGTKALVDALAELPHVEVRRNFKPLPKLRPAGPVTLVYAGVARHSYWSDEELLAFDSLVGGGSRAVFTFLPVERSQSDAEDKRADAEERHKKRNSEADKNGRKKKSPDDKKKSGNPEKSTPGDKKDKKSDGDKKDQEEEEDDDAHKGLTSFEIVAQRWGFSFGYLPVDKDGAYNRHAALIEPGGHLESDISWHSALYFKDLKPQWKVLYMCGTMPVVIERKFGDGSIVLAADSFFLSNEALRGERHPRLISRVFDGPSPIIFDEEHNNLRDEPGIASLARKYRLHGVMASLFLLAVFFVWKNAVRFVPAYEAAAVESDIVAGKESGEGFINLLRRSIQPSAVFDVCVAEWRKAFAHKPREVARVEALRAQLATDPAKARNPATAYAAISRALARKI